MFVTYYIKIVRMRVNRHNGILMSLLLLVVETKGILKTTSNVMFNMKKVDLDES